ncbi:hypothetical protein ABZ532_15490 [Streptomyces sp. NPDC019396]|uniref:hypothetical protein n=1 Tax=Streptomyces sp. NPDC019396 TaxID=3154687 RepID=UPI00340B4442
MDDRLTVLLRPVRAQFMELLRAVARSESVTVLVAAHDPDLIGLADRVVELRDGHVVEPHPCAGLGTNLSGQHT